MKIWLDGKLVDESEAKVSVFDHGLLYGDGVFEGIRFYNGRIFRLEEHIRRLFDSSRAIILDLPWTQEEVCQFTCETVAANGLTDGYIRLVVTRGAGRARPQSLSLPEALDVHHRIDHQALSGGALSERACRSSPAPPAGPRRAP